MKFQCLRNNAILPSRATPGSAGYDLCAAIDAPLVLRPGERALVPTGVLDRFAAGRDRALV